MKAEYLVNLLKEKDLTISSAESLTGGLFTKKITDIPGSSAVLKGGIVSYTNDVKKRVLGVTDEVIEKYTEVSSECAAQMATGAARLFDSDIAVSFTGYAGPGGGDEKNPVGSVFFAVFFKGKTKIFANIYSGSRSDIREKCVSDATDEIINTILQNS